MEKRKSIDSEISRLRELSPVAASAENKLDELIALLDQCTLDSRTVIRMQGKFDSAMEKNKTKADAFKPFQDLDESFASRLEMAENLENLLLTYNVDSNVSKKYLFAERLLQIVLMLTSLILICLGFALIVLPATAEFEMFTIFHFTTDDGFTLMDLIALLIVFAGVYLFIRSVVKPDRPD